MKKLFISLSIFLSFLNTSAKKKCKDNNFDPPVNLIHVVSKIDNFKSEIEFTKFIGNHAFSLNIPWPIPRYRVSGVNTITAKCVYIGK